MIKYTKLIILYSVITFINFSCGSDSESIIVNDEITEPEEEEEEEEIEEKKDPSLEEEENTTYTWEHYVGFWDLIDLSYSTPTVVGELETSTFQIEITSNSNGFLTFSDAGGKFTIENQTEEFTSLPELQGHPRIRARGEGLSSLTNNGTDPDNIKSMDVVRMTENYFKLRYREEAGVDNIYLFKRSTKEGEEEEEEEEEEEGEDPTLEEEEVAITTGLDANITGNWELILLSYNNSNITGNIEFSTYIMSIESTNKNGVLTFSDVSGEFKIENTETVFTTIEELITFPRYRVKEGQVSLGTQNIEGISTNVSIARITENYLKLSLTGDDGTNNIYTFKRVSEETAE